MTPPPPLPGAPGAPGRATWLLLLALALVPYAVGLAEPPLWDANEPLYAEPPREALESGDWLAPSWNHKPWFVRPPLSTWLTLPSYALLGVSPFAERLPMALAAMATILSTYVVGCALGGRRTGTVAALVLAATARFWLFARQLSGDVYLVACLTGAFALALPALEGREGGRRRVLWAHALVGVGVLAKGPVILFLYAVPLVAAARLARPRVPWRALRPLAGTLVVLALATPWFAYMTARYGTEYLRVYVGHHHLRRTFSDEVGSRPVWFYLVALAGDAQPWILFVPFALRRWVAARARDPASVLVWAALAFPVLFFSVPMGKRNVYLLPCYPMMACALAPFLLEVHDGARPLLARWSGGLAAGVAACACTLLVVAARGLPEDIVSGSRVYLLLCGVAAVALAVAAWRRSGRAVLATLLLTLLACEVASGLLLPVLGRYRPVPRLAEVLVREAKPGDAAVVYGTSIHSLMFYARRPTVVARNPAELRAAIPPSGRAFVLGHEHAVAGLARETGLKVVPVARAPYFQFQFSWNVLGRGRSVRDLVLLSVERGDAPPPEAPAESVR